MNAPRPTLAAALGLCLLALSAQAQEEQNWETDEHGRLLRVRFDPGTRVRLGWLGGAGFNDGVWAVTGDLELGVAYRSLFRFAEGDEAILWQLDHRVAWGRLQPWTTGPSGAPAMDLTAYGLTFLRHAEAPYLTWPSSPPRRLFFPFDIGLDAEVGRVRMGATSGGQRPDLVRIGVARAALLLDPWRSGRPGNSLEIGLAVRYDMDVLEPDRDEPDVVHRLAPFTDASVRFRYQDLSGLTSVDVRAEAFPHWNSEGGWDFAAEACARFERVLIALNDEPLSVVVEAGYHRLPPTQGPTAELPSGHDLRIQAGLAFGYQLR